MNNRLLKNSDPRLKELFIRLERVAETLERLEESSRQRFYDERYLDDKQLSQKLKISRRTLQDYRALGVLPYYLISGKVLYKESDIENVLQEARKGGIDEAGLL